VVEREQFTPSEEGTPQGGVISPLLLNVALHGLEAAAGVRYHPQHVKHAGTAVIGTPVVIRYADDLVALCTSAEQAHQVKDNLARWLAPRGLTFNEAKTRVVALEDGFDFLGFNVRRLPASPSSRKGVRLGGSRRARSSGFPRSGQILRAGGAVQGREAIAERRPRRGRP
jgi:Reverse transcriptase (RNA-dependent DNA polymerase)